MSLMYIPHDYNMNIIIIMVYIYSLVCSDNSHFVCPMGSCMESLDDCSGKG